ncbi:hypothetical protein ACFL2R_04180 [Patescibacteria group bacterium]
MNNFFSKNKYYILIVLFLGIIAGLSFGVAPYFFKKINETSIRIHEVKAENENSLNILTELPSVRNEFNEVGNRSGELREFFSDDKMVSLAQDLERIAAETGNEIEISIIESSADKKSKKDKEGVEELLNHESEDTLSVNINLRGSYADLIRYLQKIKGIKYYNDIISIRMERFSESEIVSVSTLYERRFLPVNQEVDSGDAVEESVEIKEGVSSDLEVIFYLKSE